MNFCGRCRRPIEPGSAFCSGCGAPNPSASGYGAPPNYQYPPNPPPYPPPAGYVLYAAPAYPPALPAPYARPVAPPPGPPDMRPLYSAPPGYGPVYAVIPPPQKQKRVKPIYDDSHLPLYGAAEAEARAARRAAKKGAAVPISEFPVPRETPLPNAAFPPEEGPQAADADIQSNSAPGGGE